MPESVSHLRGGQQRLAEAWDRFNAAQAAREAEIRRPARHIDVVSEDEYQRIQSARRKMKDYFNGLVYSWDYQYKQLSQRYIRAFIENYYPNRVAIDDAAVQRITDWISRGVLMYSIVLSDPSFTSDPSPGWKDVLDIDGYNAFETADKVQILKDILHFRLNLRDDRLAGQEERFIRSGASTEPGKYLGFYGTNVETTWGLGLIDSFKDFDVSRLVGVLKDEKDATYMTPKERELTAWIFQDEDTQADLETIIKMIVLSSLLELKDLGAAAARMISLIPENSSKTSISDEVKQLSDIMDKDAKGQIIWKDILEKWEEEKGAAGDELRNLIDEGLKKAETETIIK